MGCCDALDGRIQHCSSFFDMLHTGSHPGKVHSNPTAPSTSPKSFLVLAETHSGGRG